MRLGFMSSRMKLTAAIIPLVLLSASPGSACTLAPGYFYQITALTGRVVGTHSHHRVAPRWFRQSFIRKHAKLALYEYRQPWEETLLVKTIETDDRGSFDFGPLKLGNYTLGIDKNVLFDVEVKALPRKTESVTIDVSPINPDCKGGHEFLVKMK